MDVLKATWPSAKYATHQEVGIRWMLEQESSGQGGILGDEMGLGKTIQALALIVNGKPDNTLIVVPLAVRKQWQEAASRCKLNVYTADGDWTLHGKMKPYKNVFIGHYDRVVSSLGMFLNMGFDRIILDEAHRIRNAGTKVSLNIFRVAKRVSKKWLLTATPIVNSLDDAVTYLKFLGFPIESSGWHSSYEGYVRKVYLARTIGECEAPEGLCIPAKPTQETLLLEFTNEDEKTLYEDIIGNLESKWRHAQSLGGKAYMLEKLSILLRLRQVSVNPQIYIKARQKEPFGWAGPEFHRASRKFDEISQLLLQSHIAQTHNRWIVFCQFKEEMELLSEFLKGQDYIGSVLKYHGGMSLSEREQTIAESKIRSSNFRQDVILVQLQAGGTGLNLQHYNRIIFNSPWWTSALMDQAVGRAVRMGQTDVVKIYWLKLRAETSLNIDEFVMEKADTKKEIASTFLSWSIHK